MQLNPLFQWECQPEAERLVIEILTRASDLNRVIGKLEEDLLRQTSTRLFDWLDYVAATESPSLLKRLHDTGFVPLEGSDSLFVHPRAQLPRVLLLKPALAIQGGAAVGVDSIADFLMARGEHALIEGTCFGNFRRCQVACMQGAALWVVERRGTSSIEPTQEKADQIEKNLKALEKWKTRPRAFVDEEQAMEAAEQTIAELIRDVGQSRAAWTVLEGERGYWQQRNRAGQIQKSRQDRLGMGWANHDHHTFRSSRRYFRRLVHLFERLGFHCRERFYAGEEAGWGAQVMENPVSRLVLFLDVDLSPEEIIQDFAHDPLPERKELGTIGLWCALHGDSILKGGMHHLEAQFMFEDLKEDLAEQGIQMMDPFSSFSYLRQAFTVGERWRVDPERVERLVKEGRITAEQGERFRREGAIGSHLENLQRREGYKGFNQKNVSLIIKRTDPRSQG